ncbi:hypothetical protein QN277_015824 [Acacia crassicarpa]|uniref:Uncharacterized protein n=1 Tax=Acacia crassicarpa TaxID=499986 RepID=A0AAE1K1I8_9FABA|nr:hypothetical protein QN277_015824 [Acacia crassicarpa]
MIHLQKEGWNRSEEEDRLDTSSSFNFFVETLTGPNGGGKPTLFIVFLPTKGANGINRHQREQSRKRDSRNHCCRGIRELDDDLESSAEKLEAPFTVPVFFSSDGSWTELGGRKKCSRKLTLNHIGKKTEVCI